MAVSERPDQHTGCERATSIAQMPFWIAFAQAVVSVSPRWTCRNRPQGRRALRRL